MGGRLHVGTVAAFASEWVAGFARNPHSLRKNGATTDPDGVTGTTTGPETRNDNGATTDPNG
jgi:hypothetical protein